MVSFWFERAKVTFVSQIDRVSGVGQKELKKLLLQNKMPIFGGKTRTKRITKSSDSTDDEITASTSLQAQNATKYKTEMCKNYSQTGECPYHNKCRFAHGSHELESPSSPAPTQKYRTKQCRSFWEKGVCPYGYRCQFLHGQRQKPKQNNILPLLACLYAVEMSYPSRLATLLEANSEQYFRQ